MTTTAGEERPALTVMLRDDLTELPPRSRSLARIPVRRRWNLWTEAELEIVRRDYRATRENAERIAARLGRSVQAVKSKAMQLGLGKRTDFTIRGRRWWMPEEDALLSELATQLPPRLIGKRLNRGVTSVVVRMKRLGLSRRARDGWYTKREVGEMFGVDHRRVQGWIDRGELRARAHDPSSPPQKNGAGSWHIEEGDLKRFLQRHAWELNGRNVDLVAVVDILAGVLQPKYTGEERA